MLLLHDNYTGNGAFKPTISAQLSQLYEPPGPTTLREPGIWA